MARKRVDVRAILADQDLRRELMVSTIQATQAREGISTTREQADRAYTMANQADKAVFFALDQFRGYRSRSDGREYAFVSNLRPGKETARLDVARTEFSVVKGAPLAFEQIGVIARLFRDFLPLEPTVAVARRGSYTGSDAQYLRYWWELGPERGQSSYSWERYAKGGEYCRFYFDFDLVVHWDPERRTFADFFGRKGRDTARPEALEFFFRKGLSWPRRTQRGFNLRHLPKGCIFADKGPAIFARDNEDLPYLLAVGNSAVFEYLLKSLTSFGSWETSAVQKTPVPSPQIELRRGVGILAEEIHDAKALWDVGNEISTRFKQPWLVTFCQEQATIPANLDALAEREAADEARIQTLYDELNDAVYKLYGINADTRAIIEETLGERPPEILWPQMEGKTTEQKRMEHVWRLLSYAVKRVVEADADGIVPLIAVSGETALVERVRDELAALFPDQDAYQLEVDIGNELRRKVKGYRSVDGIDDWLRDCYFDYHVSLYKKRPIFWHIASRPGRGDCAFGALVHYHRFDQNRLAKLRGSYLRDAIALFRREAGLADKDGRIEDRQEWQGRLEEAEGLDSRLRWVQEGIDGPPAPGDCRIRTPWKSDDEQPDGWQPDLDDGVAVNIRPLQTAGVLRVERVV